MYKYRDPPQGEEVWWLKVINPLDTSNSYVPQVGDITWVCQERRDRKDGYCLIEINRLGTNFLTRDFEEIGLGERPPNDPKGAERVNLVSLEKFESYNIGDIVWVYKGSWEDSSSFIHIGGTSSGFFKYRFKLQGSAPISKKETTFEEGIEPITFKDFTPYRRDKTPLKTKVIYLEVLEDLTSYSNCLTKTSVLQASRIQKGSTTWVAKGSWDCGVATIEDNKFKVNFQQRSFRVIPNPYIPLGERSITGVIPPDPLWDKEFTQMTNIE